MGNIKDSIFKEYNGDSKTVKELAKEIGISKQTIYKRIQLNGVDNALYPKKRRKEGDAFIVRKATDAEIEGARMLRLLKSKLPNVQHFFNNAYFDIQDNGITDKTSEKIRRNLMLNRDKLRGVDSIIQRMHVQPDVKRFARKHEITWIDIHVAICNSAKERDNGKKKLTLEDMENIVEVIAKEFKITVEDIKGKSKRQAFFRPRMIFSYICYTKLSFAKIGKFLGNRGHATIIKQVSAMKYEMNRDADLLLKYDTIKNLIEL